MKITKSGLNSEVINYYQEYFGKDKAGSLNVLIPAAAGLVALALLALPISLMMKKFRKSKRSVLMILLIFNIGVIIVDIINIKTIPFKKLFEKSSYNDAVRIIMSLNIIANVDALIPSIDGPVIPFYLTHAYHVLCSASMFVVLYDLKLYSLILVMLGAGTVVNTCLILASLSSFCKAGPIYVNAYNLIIVLYAAFSVGEIAVIAWLTRQGFDKNATLIMSFVIIAVANVLMALKYQVWKPKIVVTTHERVIKKSPHKK